MPIIGALLHNRTLGLGVDVTYALRWYGAGVADQNYKVGQVVQFSDEGMLDGEMELVGSEVLDDAARVVSNNLLIGGLRTTETRIQGFATTTKLPVARGKVLGFKTLLGSNHNNTHEGWSPTTSQSSWYINRRNRKTSQPLQFWTTGNQYAQVDVGLAGGTNIPDWNWYVLGGFNASKEPWNGVDAGFDAGGFWIQQLDGGEFVLTYLNADTNPAVTDNYVFTYNRDDSADDYVTHESIIVPGEDLSSLLVPLVMDTFNRADGALGTADVGGAWQIVGTENMSISNNKVAFGTNSADRCLLPLTVADVVARAEFSSPLANNLRPYLILNHIDASNYTRIEHRNDSAWMRIYDVVAGVANNLGEVAITAVTPTTTPVPIVGMYDGDANTISAVYNNQALLTAPGTVNPLFNTPSSAGLAANVTGGQNADNFSVYPRRSTTQFEDVLQPYIDNLGVVAPGNPAAPLYLLEADFSVLPDSAVLNDGDPVPGIQTGSLTARQQVPGSDEPYQIISGTLRTTGDRDSWVESNSIGELVAGRAYITAMQKADAGNPVKTYRFANAPYGGRFSTAQIGSSVSNSSGSTGSRIGHVQVGTSTAGISFTRYPSTRISSQHAMVAGDFQNGEPGAGAEGVLGFEKMENDSQWLLGYVAATGNETPADQAFIIRGGSAGTDQRTVYAVVPYKPLTSVIAPKAADTFTRADAVPLNAELSEIGGIAWENLSNGGTGLTTMVHASNKVLASTGGLQSCHLNAGMADVVARVELYINGTPNIAPGLCLRTVHAYNTWSLSVNPNSNLIHIYDWNSGTPTSRASATPTTIHTDNTTPNIVVGVADGPDITMTLNDNDTITYPTATFQQTETKHGLFTYASGDHSFDNFSVHPRRSYSQYDDTLDPYVPGYTAPALIVHDEFTGNDGDDCEGRLPDTVDNGNNWFVCANDPPNTNVEIDNNRATAKNNTTNHRGLRLDTGVTDYIIEARCTSLDSTSHQSGVVFAAESGTGVNGGHYFGTLNDDIIYRPNGIQSPTDTVTFSSAAFDTNDYLVRVVKIGKTAEMLIDGVLIHSAILSDTDAGHTHAGAGLRRADIDSCQWIKIYNLS